LTAQGDNGRPAEYLREQTGASGSLGQTRATLEAVRCIAFEQPISQSGIDHVFSARQTRARGGCAICASSEGFVGADGRLRFATTEAFLRRLGLASLAD